MPESDQGLATGKKKKEKKKKPATPPSLHPFDWQVGGETGGPRQAKAIRHVRDGIRGGELAMSP